MKKIMIAIMTLLVFMFAVSAMAADVKLAWNAPTTNSDGTPLTDLAGYKMYYGPATGEYTNKIDIPDAEATSYVVTGLEDGKWYFVVTAYDTSGNESTYSNEVSKGISVSPSPPVLIDIIVVLIEDGEIKDVYVKRLEESLLIN